MSAQSNENWNDYTVEERRVADLKDHPENAIIFGNARDSRAFPEVKASIRKWGLTDPLVIKADGTILSGHVRKHSLIDCFGASVKAPVRVHPGFSSYREEIEFIIDANTKRRQLTPREIARAYRRLTMLGLDAGGEKRKRGRPTRADEKGSAGRTFSPPRGKTGAAAAARLQIGKHTAEALDTVFNTPGVPPELQNAVEQGRIKPTVAANTIKAERARVERSIKRITSATAPESEHASMPQEERAAWEATWLARLTELLTPPPQHTAEQWRELLARGAEVMANAVAGADKPTQPDRREENRAEDRTERPKEEPRRSDGDSLPRRSASMIGTSVQIVNGVERVVKRYSPGEPLNDKDFRDKFGGRKGKKRPVADSADREPETSSEDSAPAADANPTSDDGGLSQAELRDAEIAQLQAKYPQAFASNPFAAV